MDDAHAQHPQTRARTLAAGGAAPLAGLLLGAVVLLVLHQTRGNAYWNYSEGVYVLTSRLWLHGGDLYGSLVGAQPPALFAEGALALAVHDALGWLRLVLGAGQLVAGGVGGLVVWRVSGNRVAAAITPALMLLTPWALHEHGSLTPEVAALPFLLGGAYLCAGDRGAGPGGALLAVAVAMKLPFVVPAVLVVLCAGSRPRAAAGLALGTLALSLAALAVFGTGVWRDVVVAQLHSGRHNIHVLGGYGVQLAWNVSGLVVAAALALAAVRAAFGDPLLRVWAALCVGTLVTVISIIKTGTTPNVLVPVEAVLVPPAVVAVARARGARRLVAIAGIGFALAQTASLVVSPGGRFPFVYPGSSSAWGRTMSADRVAATVQAARACPAGVPYSGSPFVAFLAHRAMPAGQPDQFLTEHSSTLASTAAAIAAVGPRVCP